MLYKESASFSNKNEDHFITLWKTMWKTDKFRVHKARGQELIPNAPNLWISSWSSIKDTLDTLLGIFCCLFSWYLFFWEDFAHVMKKMPNYVMLCYNTWLVQCEVTNRKQLSSWTAVLSNYLSLKTKGEALQ